MQGMLPDAGNCMGACRSTFTHAAAECRGWVASWTGPAAGRSSSTRGESIDEQPPADSGRSPIPEGGDSSVHGGCPVAVASCVAPRAVPSSPVAQAEHERGCVRGAGGEVEAEDGHRPVKVVLQVSLRDAAVAVRIQRAHQALLHGAPVHLQTDTQTHTDAWRDRHIG